MTLPNNGLQNAIPFRWTYADATARAAASGFVTADLYSVALQLDNATAWILTATTPTWVALAGSGMANPMTTAGDLILGGSSGTPSRLAKGADSTVLTIDPSTHLPVWAAAAGGSAYGGPAFAAHKNGTDQTIPTGTFTKVTCGTENFDSAGAYDATNSKFLPLVAGYYQINAVVRWNSPTSNEFLITLYKNGSEYKRLNDVSGLTVTNVFTQAGSLVVQMNGSTDYVELFAFHTHGANRDISGIAVSTHFSGAQVG